MTTPTNKLRATYALLAVLPVALAAVGCSSSGGSPGGGAGHDGGGGGTTGNGGTITWVDDGAAKSADFVSFTRSTKDGFDQLVAVGGTSANIGLTFKVIVPTSADGGAIQTGIDYACDGAYVVFVYQIGATASHTTQSCTINATALGSATTPTSGTFSATLKDDAGATKQITSGTFSGIPTIAN
jgi:hypothetical protein